MAEEMAEEGTEGVIKAEAVFQAGVETMAVEDSVEESVEEASMVVTVAVKASERMATRQVARVVASEAVKVGVAVEGASTVAPKAGGKGKVVVDEAVACQVEDASAVMGTVGVPGAGDRRSATQSPACNIHQSRRNMAQECVGSWHQWRADSDLHSSRRHKLVQSIASSR